MFALNGLSVAVLVRSLITSPVLITSAVDCAIAVSVSPLQVGCIASGDGFSLACDAPKGRRSEKISSKGSKNKGGDQNIITSGSGIDVQTNQCMILVENGQIVEFCAEPGRYQYDSSTAPSLMTGDNKGLKALPAAENVKLTTLHSNDPMACNTIQKKSVVQPIDQKNFDITIDKNTATVKVPAKTFAVYKF